MYQLYHLALQPHSPTGTNLPVVTCAPGVAGTSHHSYAAGHTDVVTNSAMSMGYIWALSNVTIWI